MMLFLVGSLYFSYVFGYAIHWPYNVPAGVGLAIVLELVGFVRRRTEEVRTRNRQLRREAEQACLEFNRTHERKVKWLKVDYQDLPWPLALRPWLWPWARITKVRLMYERCDG